MKNSDVKNLQFKSLCSSSKASPFIMSREKDEINRMLLIEEGWKEILVLVYRLHLAKLPVLEDYSRS